MIQTNFTPGNYPQHHQQHHRMPDARMSPRASSHSSTHREMPREEYNPVPHRRRQRSYALLMFMILTLLFAGTTVYFAKQNYDLKNNPAKFTDGEKADLISRVGKLMTLPTGEDPTIATVTDLEVLKGQPFFERAQIGDKVLIYSIAKKAILFNPSSNKVVEVSPIGDSPVDSGI